MSWVALQPAASARSKHAADEVVTISVSKPGRIVQRAYLTVRPNLLPDGSLTWWTNSRPVAVEIGEGDHAGRVRLRDQGPFRTMGPTGKNVKAGQANPPMLQIAGLPGMPTTGMARHPVAWEIVGDALVVILPWEQAKGVTKADVTLGPAVDSTDAARRVLITSAPVVSTTAPPIAGIAAPAKPLPAPVAKPALSSPSIAMPYAEIERWAIEHNLGSATHGFDLDKVNERRVALGQRPVTILRKPGRGGPA